MRLPIWLFWVMAIFGGVSKCTKMESDNELEVGEMEVQDSKKFTICIGHGCRYRGWGRRRPKRGRHHKRKRGWGWQPMGDNHYQYHHHHHHHGGHGSHGGHGHRPYVWPGPPYQPMMPHHHGGHPGYGPYDYPGWGWDG